MSLQNAYVRLNTKWASKLGSPYAQYRPDSADNPISDPFQIGTLYALFDASISLGFDAPSKFANPLFAAILNPTAIQPLDFLVGDEGTFFIASAEPLKPILCVQCNRTGTFFRPTQVAGYYGGDVAANRTVLMTGIPFSELQGTKGERNAAESLPTDSRMQWSNCLVPAMPGVLLHQADRVTDDLGRNFVLSACELSDLGWRVTAELVDV